MSVMRNGMRTNWSPSLRLCRYRRIRSAVEEWIFAAGVFIASLVRLGALPGQPGLVITIVKGNAPAQLVDVTPKPVAIQPAWARYPEPEVQPTEPIFRHPLLDGR